jgi:hypothetical protein
MFIEFTHKRLREIVQWIFQVLGVLASMMFMDFVPKQVGDLLRAFSETSRQSEHC